MMEWQPIETLLEETEVLLYSPVDRPNFCVGSFKWISFDEEVFISTRGNRTTYETRTHREREWGNTLSYSATHWAPLPAPPEVG